MKLVKFYRDGELSSIKVSSAEETVSEIHNLFFNEQLAEEQIILEIYSRNKGLISDVDELRLDFDRIYSKKQLQSKAIFKGMKLQDSADHKHDFSITTILNIKDEQRYLSATFRGYVILSQRRSIFSKNTSEPLLFAALKNDHFYLLNPNVEGKNASTFKSIFHWIKKGISFKTSSK